MLSKNKEDAKMLHLEKRTIKVEVLPKEKARLLKWAEACGRLKTHHEVFIARTGRFAVEFRFESAEAVRLFVQGLDKNFGKAVSL